MMIRMLCVMAAIVGVGAGAMAADQSTEWPHWRGGRDNGSLDGANYPVKWDAGANIAWKAPLPGKGCSTPVVINQRIFVTAPVDGKDALLAFDLAGKLQWQAVLSPERKGKHRNGSGSNPSPVTDGQSVFIYFKSGALACVGMDGAVRWKTNLQERFTRDTLFWDVGTSPVLTEKDVVVAVMHSGGSYLVAFEKLTGQIHWKIDRNYTTPLEGDHSYASPIVLRKQEHETLLVWGSQHLTEHEAADGRLIWSCGDFNPQGKKNWVAVASPVVAGDVAVVPYGRGERLHGIRLGGAGDVTRTHRLWVREDTGAFVPTPAEYNGRVYLLRDKGQIERIDPLTGKTTWGGELPKNKSAYYSSPLVVDGKLYAAREDGVVFVTTIDGEFKILSENAMGEHMDASPVPLAGRLLLRAEEHLFCVEAAR